MILKSITIVFITTISLSAQSDWLTLRTGLVHNRTVIIENPDNFYFQEEPEYLSLYELTFSTEKENTIYEIGFGFLEINDVVAKDYNAFESYGFGRGATGEEYLWYYFPARIKKRWSPSSWFSVTGGIELSFMHFSNDNLFTLENDILCISTSERPYISCGGVIDFIQYNRNVLGAGLNTSLDFTVGGIRLTLFGKRDWRTGKGYQSNITSYIRSVDTGEIVEEHRGATRPVLNTWNVGIGISIRIKNSNKARTPIPVIQD